MEDGDDDFGELYADVDFQTNSSIIFDSQIAQFTILKDQQQLHCGDEATGVDKRRENDLEMDNVGGDEVRVMIDSEREEEGDDDDDDDDDDDFEVFVNDEDFGAKNGGGDAKRCSDEMVENVEGEFGIGVVEGSSIKMRVGFDEVEQGVGGNGDDCGGERGNVGKIPTNSECKYKRRNGSVFVGSQRATRSWKAEGEDVWYGKPRISGCVPSLAVNGNNFWLPWYRSIVDVDIDTIEQKSWTYPGADITDYFNYGFNEESWRNYCQSLDQLRRRMLSQTKNHVKESLRFKLKNDSGAIEEMQSDEYFHGESMQFQQLGQAIHVEDSNAERQPSTDAKRPRIRDVDAIEITVQDSDKPSNSVIEEQCNTRGTQCNISEKKCHPANSEADGEQPDVPKAYEMAKSYREETFRSSNVSCDSKRSYESATVSSHVLQHSNAQGKDQNSELDIEPLEMANTSSGQNLRAIGTAVNSMKDVDNGSESAETNLYMAGTDLSFDDHGPNSRSSSCSDTCTEASQDYFGYSKSRKMRRSSDYKKEKPQVAHIDYQHSRRYRNDKNVNDNNRKYRIRVKNSAEENLKHHGRRVDRCVDSKHNYGVDRSRAHCHLRSEERCRFTSDDEYWSGYKDNGYSPGKRYDKRFVEKRFQVECMRGFDRRDRWGFRDEVDVYFQREWSEEQLSYDRSMRRVKGVTVQKDWRAKERDCIIRDKTPCSQDEKFMLKFSSSHDIHCVEEQMDSDDVDYKKRNRHHQPFHYRYADEPVHDRYLRSNTLDDKNREHEDLDYKHERHSWLSRRELRTSGRGEYFENSMDVDYPRYTMDDDYEYWNPQTFASTHDLQDALLNDERSHRNTLCRDDTNDPELYEIYERQTNSISRRKDGGSRHVYDHRVAYNQEDPPTYLNGDDYFGRRQIVFQSHSSWTEDLLIDGSSDHESHGGSMLDSFKVVSRRKGHGVKHGYVRGGVTNHKQITRGRFGVVECDKSYSKMSTQANFEGNEPWERKELLYTDRERKSTGNFLKAGIIPNNGADGRFRDQYERRQEQDGTFPDKTMKKTQTVEASGVVLPTASRTNTSELEEGQIPTEEPRKEILKGRKYVSGHLVQKDNLERRSGHCELTQNEGHVYDENQILEIMAKMEKRRERFKDPVLVKKDTDSDNKPEEGKVVEPMDAKAQRPTRKRKWV